jgi:hypothetical protein
MAGIYIAGIYCRDILLGYIAGIYCRDILPGYIAGNNPTGVHPVPPARPLFSLRAAEPVPLGWTSSRRSYCLVRGRSTPTVGSRDVNSENAKESTPHTTTRYNLVVRTMQIKMFGRKLSCLFALLWLVLLAEETLGVSSGSDKDKILLTQLDALMVSGKKQTEYRRTVNFKR